MKTAVVGLGVIGAVHLQILSASGADICAVCDIDDARLNGYPQYPHFTDFTEMLERAKPEVVHICTPHYLHAEMVVAALVRGIHVLCEKPLCISHEEIERVLAAEKASTAQLGVCLQNRYNLANCYVKSLLDGKKVLEGTGSVVWFRDEAYYAAGPWRARWETAGGGVLINQALHTLDLLEWFIGEPKHVAATVSRLALSDAIEVEDTVSAIYTDGAHFTFFATNGGADGLPVEITLRTESEYIKILPDTVLVNGEKVDFRTNLRIYGKYCYGTGHERLIADFHDCVKTGKKFAIDGAEGVKVVKLILGAYASKGEKIRV